MMKRMNQLTDGVAARIAAKLSELQGNRTDVEMARLLGVSRPHWSHIRSGKKDISYAVVKRAGETFPAVLVILTHDLNAPIGKAS